jgi:hypothetical protein
MDNPSEGSTGPLDVNQATSLFSAALDAPEPQEPEKQAAAEPEAAPPEAPAEPDPQEAAEPQAAEEDPTVTVRIDGKDVDVPLSELKNGYQRQADYTRKTMEAAEQRKAAEAMQAQAQQERQAYVQNLQRLQAQDEAALQQQQNTDWQALLESDPVEYLKQQRIASERQARLSQVYAEQQRIAAITQAEQAQARSAYLAQQQDELLAKLPDWRDSAKAQAEKVALRDYLLEAGYDQETVSTITDAKAVLLARKAMLYDQMVGKASAAAKKVATLPQKVERPGRGDNPGITQRTAAYLKLNKTGKVEDAARAFAAIL